VPCVFGAPVEGSGCGERWGRHARDQAIAHLIHRDYDRIVNDFVTLQFIPRGAAPRPRMGGRCLQRDLSVSVNVCVFSPVSPDTR